MKPRKKKTKKTKKRKTTKKIVDGYYLPGDGTIKVLYKKKDGGLSIWQIR